MSKVTRKGREIRPSWNYSGDEWRGLPVDQLEMIESCRNTMEDVLEELVKLNVLLRRSNFINVTGSLRSINRRLDRRTVEGKKGKNP